ncbi:hypothetical protein RQP46_008136 [Phenoliferia psychrophenolica]
MIPCGGCVERGVQHLCVAHSKDPNIETGELDGPQLTAYALSELQALRDGFDSYRSRISRLELVLTKALSGGNVVPVSRSDLGSPDEPQYTPGYTAANTPSVGQTIDDFRSPSGLSRAAFGSSRPLPTFNEDTDELEAGIALEFMALGRQRQFGASADVAIDPDTSEAVTNGSLSGNPLANLNGARSRTSTTNSRMTPTPSTLPESPSPISEFPNPQSWARVAPSPTAARHLISHAIDSLGWLLCGVVHGPTFHHELEAFLAEEERAFETAKPAWIALYFALLVCGTMLLTDDKRVVLGLAHGELSRYSRKKEAAYALLANKEDLKRLGRLWFRCVVATLYSANFLEQHTLHSCQAITVLALGGRDAWSTTLIATLLSTGISIAQDLGLHHLESDESFALESENLSRPDYAKALVVRETQKRVFWALIRDEWFSIVYRRSYALRPSQITTPLPLNANDWDLSNGHAIDHPPETFTVSSVLLLNIQLARHIQSVFEDMDNSSTVCDSFSFIQSVDAQIEQLGTGVPEWSQVGGRLEGMPHYVQWMRSVWIISWKHKILTINRPFFHRALKDPHYRSSRLRSLEAARGILREAPQIGECRVWTVLYHISAACFVICLNLFQTGHPATPEADAQRAEVNAAVDTLRRTSVSSDISARGVKLILKLLADDARGRELSEVAAAASPAERNPKRLRLEDPPPNQQSAWESASPFGDPQMGFWAPGPEDLVAPSDMSSSLYLTGHRDELDPYGYAGATAQGYGYDGEMYGQGIRGGVSYGQLQQQNQPHQQQPDYRS